MLLAGIGVMSFMALVRFFNTVVYTLDLVLNLSLFCQLSFPVAKICLSLLDEEITLTEKYLQ